MTEPISGRASACVDPECLFSVRARFNDPLHVVEMYGELDLASRTAAIHACASIDHLDVLVDLSGLVFMDCAGYGALVASTTILERRGGSLVLMNPVGEPQRLLALIEQLELGLCAPLRYATPSVPRATTAPSCAATRRSVQPRRRHHRLDGHNH